jgi:phosphatidate phosphatase PAH1
MPESKYRAIAGKKQEVENMIGKRLDWAEFLLLLANLRTIEYIIKKDQVEVAELHEDYETELQEIDRALAEVEEFPSWVNRTEVEEIVNKATDRIINELKGG